MVVQISGGEPSDAGAAALIHTAQRTIVKGSIDDYPYIGQYAHILTYSSQI
jgi:hypothetical protein